MTVSNACQTSRVARVEIPVDGPLDLARTLSPLARGAGDPTIRREGDTFRIALRTAGGPAALAVRHVHDHVAVEAWGPGADIVSARATDLVGLGPAAPWSGLLRDAPDRVVGDLARRMPGIRIPRTADVLGALVPAILEQKVTGTEARRAWRGLVNRYGEAAPGPSLGLLVAPGASTLARLPYYAFHAFGVEQRRADLIRRIASRAAWFEAIVDLPIADAYARLTSIPGIGPWTAAEVAVRALGDIDALSVGDFHLPSLVSWALAREPRGDDARMTELLAPYAGRRALVVRLIESSGIRAPRYGPRLAPRRIEGI